MKLALWKPEKDFDSFVERFFEVPESIFMPEGFNWSPSADIVEKEKSYEVSLELPGVEKSEIEVSFKDNILTIKGERKHEEKNENEKDGYVRRESRYGMFERSFRFGEPVLDDKINAQYKNGVLKVTVPKTEVPEPKITKIEIK